MTSIQSDPNMLPISMPVTIRDVARSLNLSPTTVCRVLNNPDTVSISAATRERVRTAARQMGYQRNQLARAMITGKSRILGVLTTPASGENFVRILAGAVEAVSSNDYLLKMIHVSYAGIDDATIARCLAWKLAGAIVMGLSEQSTRHISQEFAHRQLPLVMIDDAPPLEWGISIRSDEAQGMRLVVSHLTALGHRRIAFLNGEAANLSDCRATSFRDALSEHGLSAPDHWIRYTSWTEQDVIEEAARAFLLESKDCRPTAIVCSADSIAMVVQRVAWTLGLRLPEDLSVTGYSNSDLSSFAHPPLTTVDQSFHSMGYSAALRLVESTVKNQSVENGVPHSRSFIPTGLRIRQSTTTAPLP